MKSFTYDGKSTDTIVDKPLSIVQFDNITDIDGFTREIIKGDKTLTRQEANHYGSMYSDDMTYDFYLVKNDGSPFTDEEQRKVNKWLTSPRLPKSLNANCDDGDQVIYKGIFTNIGWKMITGHWDGVKCSFTCDVPFAWKTFSKTYSITNSLTTSINIPSDDSEYEVYPKITIKSTTRQTIIITNTTDNNNKMTISLNPNLPAKIDCKNCIISDATSSGVIDFEDLGWSDATNIYWMKLFDGDNSLKITGSCELTIEFEYPVKRAGDFV